MAEQAVAPREVPILFSAEMVKAIRAGRKTQTRRVLKPQPPEWIVKVRDIHPPSQDDETGEWGQVETIWKYRGGEHPEPMEEVWRPLRLRWKVGDHLWVRERWSGLRVFQDTKPSERVSFVADGTPYLRDQIWYWADGDPPDGDWEKPRAGMFMPRWASRITLLVTEVGVERLHAITEDGARREGITDGGCLTCGEPEPCHCSAPQPSARDAFASIWQKINGVDSWNANPWVAPVTFEKVKP